MGLGAGGGGWGCVHCARECGCVPCAHAPLGPGCWMWMPLYPYVPCVLGVSGSRLELEGEPEVKIARHRSRRA